MMVTVAAPRPPLRRAAAAAGPAGIARGRGSDRPGYYRVTATVPVPVGLT